MSTEQLIHRIFLPNKPSNIEWFNLLPRMSRNDNVNQELYALIGLILRQFVQSWYSKITDDDQFLIEITNIISKINRLVEQRVVKLDLDSILLDKIPFIIDSHIQDYRLIIERRRNGFITDEELEKSFHRIHPHKALDSVEDEQLFLKLLSKGLMAVLLDDDSVNSSPARALVSSILNEIVLKNAIEKLSEPWMIDDIIVKVCLILNEKKNDKNSRKLEIVPTSDPTFKQPISSQFSILYNQIVKSSASMLASGGKVLALVISLSNNGKMNDISVKGSIDTDLPVDKKLEDKIYDEIDVDKSRSKESKSSPTLVTPSIPHLPNRRIFSLLSHISHLDKRNPLLVSTLSTLSIPFIKNQYLSQLSSRACSYFIDKYIRNESVVTTILRSSRENLFPNGFMGPSRIVPTAEEQIELHEQAIQSILDIIPERLRYIVFGSNPQHEIEDILTTFSSRQINKHLIYQLIDLLITTILPELTKETPHEILKRRFNDL